MTLIGSNIKQIAIMALVIIIAFVVPFRSIPLFCSYPRLDGKVYLITGASSGIGRGLAMHFAERGANLILVARRAQELAETARLCGNKTQLVQVVGDVVERSVATKLKDIVTNDFGGRLDVLVLNHALLEPILIQEKTVDDYEAEVRKVFDINLFSSIRLALTFREELERANGKVVGMGSTGQFLPPLFMSAYGMGKSAFDSFFDHLYLEQRMLNRTIQTQYFIIGEIMTEKLQELSKQASDRAVPVDSAVLQMACLLERPISRAYVPFYLTAPLESLSRILQPLWPAFIDYGWISPNPEFKARVVNASKK